MNAIAAAATIINANPEWHTLQDWNLDRVRTELYRLQSDADALEVLEEMACMVDFLERISGMAPNFSDFRVMPDGTVRCIAPFMFTHAILAELTDWGYLRRWCYPTYLEARLHMELWIKENTDEPDHWIRRTHIEDEYPPEHKPGDRMSDYVNGRKP